MAVNRYLYANLGVIGGADDWKWKGRYIVGYKDPWEVLQQSVALWEYPDNEKPELPGRLWF